MKQQPYILDGFWIYQFIRIIHPRNTSNKDISVRGNFEEKGSCVCAVTMAVLNACFSGQKALGPDSNTVLRSGYEVVAHVDPSIKDGNFDAVFCF